MRKIVVLSFISLDGVMQAPGGPEEDPSNDFKYGGWSFHYFDEAGDKVMGEQLVSADLLLGRKTYDIFSSYWPEHGDFWPGINDVTKYVVSNTVTSSDWNNCVFIDGDVVEQIKQLKAGEGTPLQVHGSGELIQTLLKHDMVDELWLKFFPVTLGRGKRLFDGGAIPAAFKLESCTATPSGVIFANYSRAGDIQTGSFA
jgi:dihydrofolate reductase